MNWTRLSSTLLVASLATAAAAPSYPIAPRSLLQLYGDADLIVVARVDEPCTAHEDPESLWGNCARLEPSEVLAGERPCEPIHVRYTAGLICPAPARYEVGERVLAFLRSDPDEDVLVTCSLSYGTKYLDDEGLGVYRERIAELARIDALEDPYTRLAATVEWLVKCAEHPATLDEALLDLTHGSRPDAERGYAGELDALQCARLAEVLLTAQPRDERYPYGCSRILSVLADTLDDEILHGLARDFDRAPSLQRAHLHAQRLILEAFAERVIQLGR